MYKDLTEARREVRQLLPQFLYRVMASYQNYLAMPGAPFENDPKQYSAYHAAAKTALAHLDALARLQKAFEAADADDAVSADALAELDAARAELKSLDAAGADDA